MRTKAEIEQEIKEVAYEEMVATEQELKEHYQRQERNRHRRFFQPPEFPPEPQLWNPRMIRLAALKKELDSLKEEHE